MIEVKGRVTLDGSGWNRTLGEIQRNTHAWGTTLARSIGAMFSIGFATSFAKSLIDGVERIKDLSEQLDISTDDFQRLDMAATRAGVKVEVLAQAIGKLGAMRRKAGEGDEGAMDIFRKFGITESEIQNANLSNLQLLEKVLGNAGNLGPAGQAELRDLLGGRWGKIRAMFQELREMGPIELIDNEQIKTLDAATKKLELLNTQIKVYATETMGKLAGGNLGMLYRINPLTAPFMMAWNTWFGKKTTPPPASTEPPAQSSEPLFENRAQKKQTAETLDRRLKAFEALQKNIESARLSIMPEKSRRAAIIGRINDLLGADVGVEERMSNLSEAVSLIGQLRGPGPSRFTSPDALSAIGGYLGPSGFSAQKEQVDVAKRLLDRVNEIADTLKDS